MKVNIQHEGKSGWVQYDPLGKEVMVSHSNALVRNTVNHYLSNEKHFKVPASDNVGHYMNISAVPTSSSDYMQMALSEMFHATGVHVNWGHEDHDGGVRDKKVPNNDDANEPILKSVWDDTQYVVKSKIRMGDFFEQ